MKTKSLVLLSVLLLSLLAVLPISEVKASTTVTFYSTASDGYINPAAGAVYNTVWTSSTGNIDANIVVIDIGQTYGAELYTVFRAFVFFGTSSLPDGNEIITSAKLSLKAASTAPYANFNITVQNGQPTYSHDPLEAGDYAKGNYSGNGGQFDTTLWTPDEYFDIELNSDGISWINKTGTTKLCLRSDKDIAGIAPSTVEVVAIGSSEGYSPRLVVTYMLPVEVTVVKPENVTYTLSTIPVNITAVAIGDIDKIWYNCKNDSEWIYSSNQTYTSPTNMLGFNDGTYTFYTWANNTEGYKTEATVVFSVDFAFRDGAVYSDYYTDWNWARNNASGIFVHIDSLTEEIWAEYDEPDYDIGRLFFYFDTSYIPDNAIITSATLRLYCYPWGEGIEVRLVAQKGTQADELTLDDYSSFSGGEYGHSAVVIDSQYNNITFNSLGMNEINRTGITKICVREYDHDFLDSSPDYWYGSSVEMAEAGEDYRPMLVITYTLPPTLPPPRQRPTPSPEEVMPWFPLTFYVIMVVLFFGGLYLYVKHELWLISVPLIPVIAWLLQLKPYPPHDFHIAIVLAVIAVCLLLNKLREK